MNLIEEELIDKFKQAQSNKLCVEEIKQKASDPITEMLEISIQISKKY